MNQKILALVVAMLFNASLALSQNEIAKKPTARLLDHIVGLYNNKAQSDTSTSALYRPQETRIYRILGHRENEYWLYWGWFAAGLPDRPLEERLVHIVEQEGDRWQANIYFVPEQYQKTKQWNETRPFRGLEPAKLEKDKCDCTILAVARDNYKMESTPCRAIGAISERANFFTLSMLIKNGWMSSNTSFLDKDKNEVFHHQGSIMERISKTDFNRAFDAGKDLTH
jgi:hypothetical protein